ncbi:YlxR family protein [Dermatophilaceae bacterium Sec6.4]
MVERERIRHATSSAVAHRGLRTCVGCRSRADRSELLRVAAVAGDDGWSVVLNVRGCLPGRGAWLHPDLQCLDKAVKRRALSRAFPVTHSREIDVRPLRDSICEITARLMN